jgi:hypothetical protein
VFTPLNWTADQWDHFEVTAGVHVSISKPNLTWSFKFCTRRFYLISYWKLLICTPNHVDVDCNSCFWATSSKLKCSTRRSRTSVILPFEWSHILGRILPKKWIFTINWLSFKRRAPLHNYSCPTMDKTCPRVGNRVVYDFNVTICMLSSPLKSKRHDLKFISITVHHGTCGETFSLVHHRTKGKDWTDRLAARSNDTHPITLQKKSELGEMKYEVASLCWPKHKLDCISHLVPFGYFAIRPAVTWPRFLIIALHVLWNQMDHCEIFKTRDRRDWAHYQFM